MKGILYITWKLKKKGRDEIMDTTFLHAINSYFTPSETFKLFEISFSRFKKKKKKHFWLIKPREKSV